MYMAGQKIKFSLMNWLTFSLAKHSKACSEFTVSGGKDKKNRRRWYSKLKMRRKPGECKQTNKKRAVALASNEAFLKVPPKIIGWIAPRFLVN